MVGYQKGVCSQVGLREVKSERLRGDSRGFLAKDWVAHTGGDIPGDGAEWALYCEAES